MVQVGMPADQAQYIHRVGRTARAGKQGQALLLLHDFERFFLRNIAELPVTQIKPTPVEVTSLLNFCLSMFVPGCEAVQCVKPMPDCNVSHSDYCLMTMYTEQLAVSRASVKWPGQKVSVFCQSSAL